MKRFLILYYFIILIFLSLPTRASYPPQDITKQITSPFKQRDKKDTIATTKSLKQKKIIQVADTLTLSDYMLSVERVNDNLNDIRDSAQLNFEVVHLERKINSITNNIKLLRQNSRDRRSAVNIKNTYLYQSFANSLDEENNRLRARVSVLYNRTYRAKQHLKNVLSDSIFKALSIEKNIPEILNSKLTRLDRKWIRTDSIVKTSIDTLNLLQVGTADNAVNLSNMLNIMDKKLDRARPQIFGHETSPLWQIHKKGNSVSDSIKTFNILSTENKAIGYYVNQTADKKKFMLFLALILFTWLISKNKVLSSIRRKNVEYEFLHLNYLLNFPWLSVVVLLLCLTPFFDAYAPNSYIIIEYILLLLGCSYIFGKVADRKFLNYWGGLVILFIINAATFLLIEPSFFARLWMIGLHTAIFLFSYKFYKNLSNKIPYYKWIRSATVIGLILTALAILSNLFGRFSLSGIFGFSAIFAITHALVLPVFIEIVMEIILFQLLSSRLKKGIENSFNISVVTQKIKSPLIWISILIWFVMLSSNLNIFHTISSSVIASLTQERTVGSISFKLSSVLLFFIIIWSSHILQRLISYLYGETGSESEDQTNVSKGHHSRLLITRLLVLIAGYLLAIAASGLPIDKLTFLLGALGVGIGMGLQSVVNNFVSGIILIFDGSLHIGDEIEVNQQTGRVKEIGLRASTLHTADGADIIIPNGTILSQNIVNYSSEQKRITISFSLTGKELDTNEINEVINSTLKKIPNVLSKRNPVILYTKVTPESLSITTRFWCTTVNTDQIKSEAVLQLSAGFSAKSIGFE